MIRRRVLLPLAAAAAAIILATAGLAHGDTVITAPVGEGTTGAAAIVPPRPVGGGGGRPTPGVGVYFETRNLSRGLPWSSIPAAKWRNWSEVGMTAVKRRSLEDGNNTASIERTLVRTACRDAATAKTGCFLWYNACPSGATQLHRREYDGAADRGQVACQTPNWLDRSGEFHAASPDGLQGKIDQLSQWEVQVWRQGVSRPIFERRIALDAHGNLMEDADPSGVGSAAWWLSGGGLAGAADSATGGPLGSWESARDAGYAGCEQRYRSAPHVIVARVPIGGTATQIAYTNSARNGSPKPAVGGDTFNCFWGGWSNGGRGWLTGSDSKGRAPCARCFYEGIALTWQVPTDARYAGGGVVKASFSYRILGKPNTFYAIRIASLDGREQLLMPNAFHPASHVYSSQYFHVFMPTSLAGFDFDTPICDCSPSP